MTDSKDIVIRIIEINQLIFIRDLVIEKRLIKCNIIVISIKSRLIIKITYSQNYKKSKL